MPKGRLVAEVSICLPISIIIFSVTDPMNLSWANELPKVYFSLATCDQWNVIKMVNTTTVKTRMWM